MPIKNKYIFLFLVATLGMTACKKWDDHIRVTNQDLNQNLMQAISANADLSTFREYITKTGLDNLLQSSKTYTVWAPINAALQGIDPAIVNDTARLKAFVLNHISNQTYFIRDAQAGLRVAMLNGKYNNFSGNKFDEATITSADKFVANGVLHVVDKRVPVLPSIWEYINTSTAQYEQNAFVASLNYEEFDPSLATIDSISASTGLPVYKPGSGLVLRNKFNDRIYNLKREDRQYTYFVLDNAGFALESDSLDIYFKTGNTTSTDSLSKWNTAKDLVLEGYYTAANLPSSFVSASGIRVPLDPSAIVQSIKLSNGIVHIMSRVDVPNMNKFGQIILQGEDPSGFLSDRRGNTNYRVRFNPVTGENYNDIMISGHGVTGYYAFYRINETPSIKYKVYSMAVNDFQTGAFTQNIVAKYMTAPGTYTTLGTLPQAVPLKTAATAYTEMYLGEFTLANYGTLEMQLTASGTNPLVLDYLLLVPVP